MTVPPIKVTIVTTSFPLVEGRVSGVFVARLTDHFGDDVAVEVVTPASRDQVTVTTRKQVSIHPFRYAPKRWQILAQEPGGIPVALHEKPWLYLLLPGFLGAMLIACLRQSRHTDVYHANWAICGCIAGIAGWLRHIPVVTTLRGDDVTRARNSWIDRLILNGAALFSAQLICVSHAIRAWVNNNVSLRQSAAEVIENGVDESFLRVGDERLHRKDAAPLRLLAVGSLIARKGVDVLIKAIGQLHAEANTLQLEIVGSGPEWERLTHLVAHEKLQQDIRFLGELDPIMVPGELAAADVFVLASREEGRPNVVLEAMAAGLPVIGSDIDGIAELIEHERTGLLFKRGSVTALAQALRRVIDDPGMRIAMGKVGRQAIDRRGLHWRNAATTYANLYRKLCGAH